MEYSFLVKDDHGEKHQGYLWANNQREAAQILIADGFYILDIKEVSPMKIFWRRLNSFFNQSNRKEAMMFFQQLSLLISGGINFRDCFFILSQHEKRPAYKKFLIELQQDIDSGKTLLDSFRRHPKFFSPFALSFVQAGEMSGSLEMMLTKLASYIEHDFETQENFKTILFYPMILSFTMIAVVIFLFSFVLPNIFALFDNLHQELPLPTLILFEVQQFFENYFFYALFIFFVILIFFVKEYFSKQTVRLRCDYFLLKIPLIGKLFLLNELVRIADTLHILLSSGLILETSLQLLQQVIQNEFIKQYFFEVYQKVRKGQSFVETLAAQDKIKHILPANFLNLLATAEVTGEFDLMLQKIAKFYSFEEKTLLKRLQSMIEPCLILFLGGLVALIVFSIALPLFDSMTNF